MPGPFQGVRVLDLSVIVSGPLATMILADQGAEVIKVEAPPLGDVVRYLGSSRNGTSALFANCNRGKRSVVIDTRQARGRELLLRLAERADVLVQNFRPGAAERMGLGWETVHARNPALVYVSISGFGAAGPLAGKRVYDNVIQAYSGIAAVQRDPDGGEPTFVRQLVCDKATSLYAVQAISAALFARERGAGGQHIELSMLDAGVGFLWPDGMMDRTLLADDVLHTPTLAEAYRAIPTADGHVTVAVLSDAEFAGWCRALGRPELARDPRFADLTARTAHVPELVATLGEIIQGLSTEELLRRCEENDVPCAPITAIDDIPREPQVRENALLLEWEDPLLGPLRQPRPAARFGATPAEAGRSVPRLGEHTNAVLSELGLDPAKIAELRGAGAVA